MSKYLKILAISVVLFSCVLQSEHDRVIYEKKTITEERDKLFQELEGIKFGAPNLLADGKRFYEAKDFSKAREKFQLILEKHPDLQQSIDAKRYLANIAEDELWYNASNSEDVTFSENYISKYPNGKYINKARVRFDELKILNMQKAYDAALSQDNSYSWKKFLADYPDHSDAYSISKRIIRLEVNEISGDQQTGQMPTFNQSSSTSSSNSSVQITNDTGCELTIRYSGPDAEMIIIPVGGTRTAYLPSGSYKIAASACGTNYAGTESIYGEYNSRFYIRRH